MNLRQIPFAALVFATIAPGVCAQTIDLKQQWMPGKKYFQTIKMVQNSTFKLGEQAMKQAMEMTMDVSTTVRAPEGAAGKRLGFRYERLAADIETMGQKMSFDTSKKDAPDPMGMGKAFGPIVGKEIKMALDDQDQVSGIENLEEIVGGAAANPMAGQVFSKESITEVIRQSMLQALPGKPVKPGDSWPAHLQQQIGDGLDVAVKGTYTFKGMGERAGVPCAELLVNGTIAAEMAAGASNPRVPPGMKLERGSMKGTVWFDPKLGAVRESDVHQEMTLSLKNPTNPAEIMSVPVVQNVSLKLTKIEDSK